MTPLPGSTFRRTNQRFMMPTFGILWGLMYISPAVNVYHISKAVYDGLDMWPSWAWGTWSLLAGLTLLFGELRDKLWLRLVGTFGQATLLLVVACLFLFHAPVGFVTFGVFGVFKGLHFFELIAAVTERETLCQETHPPGP